MSERALLREHVVRLEELGVVLRIPGCQRTLHVPPWVWLLVREDGGAAAQPGHRPHRVTRVDVRDRHIVAVLFVASVQQSRSGEQQRASCDL